MLLFVAACSTIAVFGYVRRERIPGIRNYFPSPTPAPTSGPHILVHQPVNYDKVRMEDFSTNAYDWSAYYWFNKVELLDGKLLLQSNRTGYGALTTCTDNDLTWCFTHQKKYYLQADFATSAYPTQPYGLVFGMDSATGNYYSFDILPSFHRFMLLKRAASDWDTLVPLTTTVAIRPYPEVNTLSVYFNGGRIELYVNGKSVSTYTDTNPYTGGKFGASVAGPGFELIVDNFFAFGNP